MHSSGQVGVRIGLARRRGCKSDTRVASILAAILVISHAAICSGDHSSWPARKDGVVCLVHKAGKRSFATAGNGAPASVSMKRLDAEQLVEASTSSNDNI
eukprot:scaffold115701_cov75-Phaeocystis_antarctica.AAC.3